MGGGGGEPREALRSPGRPARPGMGGLARQLVMKGLARSTVVSSAMLGWGCLAPRARFTRGRAGPPARATGDENGPLGEDRGGGERLQRARNAAMSFLSYRIRAAAELHGRLVDKGFSEAEADVAVRELQEAGLQSDADFAVAFVRSKWRASQWSPRRISSELQRKGVAPGDIDLGLGEVFGANRMLDARALQDVVDAEKGAEEVPDPGLGFGPTGGLLAEGPSPEVELLETARRRVQQMGDGVPREAKRRRLSGWLQRRGYSWDVVKTVLAGAGL